MSGDVRHECDRCGVTIRHDEDHTELVRRDFRGEPQPSKIQYLCGSCLEEFLDAFLASDGQG